jgi:hypothetical protein
MRTALRPAPKRRGAFRIEVVAAAQVAIPWTSAEPEPKKADLKAWADHICSVAMSGATQEHRRHLFRACNKTSLFL